MQYYICWYLLDKKHRFLIYCSNDKDSVFVENGKVPVFSTEKQLLSYAAVHNIKIESEEPILHDLDFIGQWSVNPKAEQINCFEFTAAWNFFADLSNSVNGKFDADRKMTQKVYDKLFWGNNLPSVTPPGKKYEPIWSEAQVQLLKKTLTDGLELFRANITEKVKRCRREKR